MDKIDVYIMRYGEMIGIYCVSSVQEIRDLTNYINTLSPDKNLNEENLDDIITYVIMNNIYCGVEIISMDNEEGEILKNRYCKRLQDENLFISSKLFIDAMFMTNKGMTNNLIGKITDIDEYYAKSFWSDKFEIQK